MDFLKKVGKVGGAANKDFRFAIGIDEGPSTKATQDPTKVRKSKDAFRPCTESGVIDNMTEDFPVTSSGTQWNGFTDQVMGGCSMGTLTREKFEGKWANILRGKVSLENNGGFIQMATDIAVYSDIESNTVDASKYDGVELDVRCEADGDHEEFNIQ
jgi:hypothetical protein